MRFVKDIFNPDEFPFEIIKNDTMPKDTAILRDTFTGTEIEIVNIGDKEAKPHAKD